MPSSTVVIVSELEGKCKPEQDRMKGGTIVYDKQKVPVTLSHPACCEPISLSTGYLHLSYFFL